jgi:hypothetical protein
LLATVCTFLNETRDLDRRQPLILGRSVFVTLDAMFNGVGKHPWGHRRAGFSASTEIDRREWGLEWNQTPETGGVLVGHTGKVQVDMEAVEQEASGKAAA